MERLKVSFKSALIGGIILFCWIAPILFNQQKSLDDFCSRHANRWFFWALLAVLCEVIGFAIMESKNISYLIIKPDNMTNDKWEHCTTVGERTLSTLNGIIILFIIMPFMFIFSFNLFDYWYVYVPLIILIFTTLIIFYNRVYKIIANIFYRVRQVKKMMDPTTTSSTTDSPS